MILDNELNGEKIAMYIREMYEKDFLRNDMQRASRGLGRNDACNRVVDIAESLIRKSKNEKTRSQN